MWNVTVFATTSQPCFAQVKLVAMICPGVHFSFFISVLPCRSDSGVFDSIEEKKTLPGPVMVCGPPGTEPIANISQTRFDDEESLVYSRVSSNISLYPSYIHRAGNLHHIPPKDTPIRRAEVLTTPRKPQNK